MTSWVKLKGRLVEKYWYNLLLEMCSENCYNVQSSKKKEEVKLLKYKKFIEKISWYSPIIIGSCMGFNIVVGLAVAAILCLIPKWTKTDAFLVLFFYFFLYALSKLLHNEWLSPNFNHGNVHTISFIGIFLWFIGVVMVKKLFLYFRQKKKVQ